MSSGGAVLSGSKRVFVSQEALTANGKALHFVRVYLSVVGGVVAGILGATNFAGFFGYAVTQALVMLVALAKMGFKVTEYFPSWSVAMNGVGAGMMTYILFWTLSYNIVHLY